MSEIMCARCKVKSSTGCLVELCDACFDEWEAEMTKRKADSPTGRIKLADHDLEVLADDVVVRRN